MRRTTLLLSFVLALTLAACGDDAGDGASPSRPATSPDAGQGPAVDDGTADPRVLADGRDLVLEQGTGRQVLATLDPERDGELEHVALRPGAHEALTVLALTRVEERYELRYLVADGERVSDLYWFPWRLQVEERLAPPRDVAPRPVWSPSGGKVAWIEWSDEGTRLRTVGWIDADGANNPADEAGAYQLADVPAGTRLERWDTDGPRATLVGSDGEVEWHIELHDGDGAEAMPVNAPVGP